MPETAGLGTDICFFGAREDVSRDKVVGTSSAAGELAINVGQISEIFGLFGLGGVSSVLGWV